METPFFRNSYGPNYSPTPSHRNPPSRKVVSIPVHFIDSERQKSSSVLKIQKVFRGFLVRKSVNKIVAIKTHVDEIERRISQKETLDLIRRDSKERLKVNEMLMALLFKLDSIRGVDSGVRDLRKAVIKKAILLQERVDAVVAESQTSTQDETLDQTSNQNKNLDQTSNQDETLDDGEIGGEDVEIKDVETVEDSANRTLEVRDSEKFVDQTLEMQNAVDGSAIVADVMQNEESMPIPITQETEEVNESVEEDEFGEKKEVVKEMLQTGQIEGKGDDIVKCSSNLMEQMMEKNEKLMELVAGLCERNALQTQMISSLSQRVENLERAVKNDRLRRKKKRQAAAGTDKVEVTKCGRKL